MFSMYKIKEVNSLNKLLVDMYNLDKPTIFKSKLYVKYNLGR